MSESCQTCVRWVSIADENYRFERPPPTDPKDWSGSWAERQAAVDKDWGTEWGTCNRQDYPESPMFTNDASDYFSALRTKPGFSCSEWSDS